MTRTYKVTKGSQYDESGATVEMASLYSQYNAAGEAITGTIGPLDPEVKAALLRVIATGQAKTVTTGKPTAPEVSLPEIPGLCPHCGTVCHGDCEAA